MADRARSMFQLRPSQDGRVHRLVYRYPFRSPAARAALLPALHRLRADGVLDAEPNSITLGEFGPDGFRPLPRWIAALGLPSVRDRITEDLAMLYGPGGVYAVGVRRGTTATPAAP